MTTRTWPPRTVRQGMPFEWECPVLAQRSRLTPGLSSLDPQEIAAAGYKLSCVFKNADQEDVWFDGVPAGPRDNARYAFRIEPNTLALGEWEFMVYLRSPEDEIVGNVFQDRFGARSAHGRIEIIRRT